MKKLGITGRNMVLYGITLAVVLIGDQLSKIIVSSSMRLSSSHTIIDNFFYFTYAHNEGAAWGMLEGKISLFLLVSVVAAIGMIYYFTKTTKEEVLTRFGLVLAFAGAIGNLIDRVCFGYVRDFIDFIILGYNFPIFNIADMALVIGIGLIILEILLGERKNGKNTD